MEGGNFPPQNKCRGRKRGNHASLNLELNLQLKFRSLKMCGSRERDRCRIKTSITDFSALNLSSRSRQSSVSRRNGLYSCHNEIDTVFLSSTIVRSHSLEYLKIRNPLFTTTRNPTSPIIRIFPSIGHTTESSRSGRRDLGIDTEGSPEEEDFTYEEET